MYIIVGLGNPGREYEHTRHNAGFDTLSILARALDISVSKSECKALTGRGQIGGETVILAQPQTFMNLSGESVVQLLSWYKCEPDHLIVCYDDIDLPLGTVRVRGKGSAGTHNGMRSIIYLLGRDDFPRVRLGVGKPDPRWSLADYVLSRYETDEQKTAMQEAMNLAARAVQTLVAEGVEAAMRLTAAQKGEEKKDSAPRYSFAALAQSLSGHVASGALTGAACAVSREGRTLYQGMFGLTESGAKMRKDVIWPLGELTRLFTAACVLMLRDYGKLDLSDPVADYLPDFGRMRVYEKDGYGRTVGKTLAGALFTVEDALRLRTGMGQCEDSRAEWARVCASLSPEDRDSLNMRARWMSQVPLSSLPGKGTGDDPAMAYDVLAALCAQVSGMPFETLLDVEFFAPLGMGDTGFSLSEGQRDRLAFGDGALHVSGHSGLYAAVPSLLRFCQMLQMGGLLGGARLLSEDSVRLLLSGLGGFIPAPGDQGDLPRGSALADSGTGAQLCIDYDEGVCGLFMARCEAADEARALQDETRRKALAALRFEDE